MKPSSPLTPDINLVCPKTLPSIQSPVRLDCNVLSSPKNKNLSVCEHTNTQPTHSVELRNHSQNLNSVCEPTNTQSNLLGKVNQVILETPKTRNIRVSPRRCLTNIETASQNCCASPLKAKALLASPLNSHAY